MISINIMYVYMNIHVNGFKIKIYELFAVESENKKLNK